MSKVREFIDFWVENTVHATDRYRSPGRSQDVTELTRRCIEAAGGQGISEDDMKAEVGDLTGYLRVKLVAANKAEAARRDAD